MFCCPNNNQVDPERKKNSQDETQSGDINTNDENMVELQDSVADLRSSGVEPSVELRYNDQGTGASTITAVSADHETLPGPSRVVTGPGQTGQCYHEFHSNSFSISCKIHLKRLSSTHHLDRRHPFLVTIVFRG